MFSGVPPGWPFVNRQPEPEPEPGPEAEIAGFNAADPVFWWRFENLLDAGWPDAHALLLAEDHEIDLHVACGLIERGCDVKTAWNILR